MTRRREVLLGTLTAEEARALTDRVKRDAAELWTKLVALYEGEAHIVLGYASWASYFEAEFGRSGTSGYRVLQAGRVLRRLPIGSPAPANEAVAREISRAEPDRQAEVWKTSVERHGERPTAAQVREVVDGDTEQDQRPSDVLPPTANAGNAYEDRLKVIESLVQGLKVLEWPPPADTFDASGLKELHVRISRCASELGDVESWLGKTIARLARAPVDEPSAPCGKRGHQADWRLRATHGGPAGPWRCRVCSPCRAASEDTEWRTGAHGVVA